MARYFVRRFLIAVAVVWAALTFIFFALRMLPGDVLLANTGEQQMTMTEEERAAARAKLGLDRPLYVQYADWFGKVILHGDFGVSQLSKRPVLPDLAVRIPRTLELALGGLLLGTLLGIPAGILCALRRNSWVDRILTAVLVFLGSLPVYVAGIVLLAVFGLQLKWVPVGGFTPLKENAWDHLRALSLPCTTLGLWLGAVTARMTRSSLLEVLSQDYIRTAYAKGLSSRAVNIGHALKNAAIPVVTSLGLSVGSLLGGAVLTETVFTWPGLGLMFVNSVIRRDYPTVQAVVIVTVVAFIFTNMLVDMFVGLLDPRISYD